MIGTSLSKGRLKGTERDDQHNDSIHCSRYRRGSGGGGTAHLSPANAAMSRFAVAAESVWTLDTQSSNIMYETEWVTVRALGPYQGDISIAPYRYSTHGGTSVANGVSVWQSPSSVYPDPESSHWSNGWETLQNGQSPPYDYFGPTSVLDESELLKVAHVFEHSINVQRLTSSFDGAYMVGKKKRLKKVASPSVKVSRTRDEQTVLTERRTIIPPNLDPPGGGGGGD